MGPRWAARCISLLCLELSDVYGKVWHRAFSPDEINKVIDSLGKSLVELNFGLSLGSYEKGEGIF